MRALYRLLGVFVVLLLLFGLSVNYGAYTDSKAVTAEEIDADPGSHVGEEVHITGRLESVDPAILVTRYSGSGVLRLELEGLAGDVEQGDRLDVYGELLPGGGIEVEDAVVYPGGSRRYMFGISLLGLFLASGLFLRHWRFDGRDLIFHRREQ